MFNLEIFILLRIQLKIYFIFYFNFKGRAPKDAELKAMVEEAQGPINFTMLLTLFGDRLNGT